MTLTALLLPLLASTTMFVIDYEMALKQERELSSFADAAALSAARAMTRDIVSGTVEEVTAKTKAKKLASDMFSDNANLMIVPGSGNLDIVVQREGDEVVGKLVYTAKTKSTFTFVDLGLNRVRIESEARMPIRKRIDVHFVIDNSPSMGIGASQQDQDLMIANMGCAFACHRGWHWRQKPEYAHQIGAELRLDVVTTATRRVLSRLKEVSSREVSNKSLELNVAVHSFSNLLETRSELSDDIDGALTALAGIDLAKEKYQGGTFYHGPFKALADKIKAGDRDAGGPPDMRFVIAMTDAISTPVRWWSAGNRHQWSYNPDFVWYGDRYAYVQGLDPMACAPIKAIDKTNMMMLNLEYLIPREHSAVDRFVKDTLLPQIPWNTQNCASSPREVFEANNPAEIEKALDEILESVISRLGLRLSS